MSQPLVSVIIPVFNGASLVGEAIESALAQSWPATEVIVVDDGSTDGGATRRAVARFGDAVRLVSKENGGVATALNAGVAAMRGEWFAWLSHDDVYHPERIARHMAVLLARPPGTIAFGDADEIAADGSFVTRRRHTEGFPEDGGVGDGVWAVIEARLNGCAVTLPRACIVDAGGFDPGLPTTQDYALWYRLALRHPFVPVPGALVRQRTHPGQGSRIARHLDEVSVMWARFLEDIEAMAGSPADRLARLMRAERTLRITAFAGARLLVAARLRHGAGAFAVDVVLRGVGAAADVSRCLGLVAATGARIGRVTIVDEGASHEPALRHRLPEASPVADMRVVRSRRPPTPDHLAEMMLGSGSGPLVALLDAGALPGEKTFRHGFCEVAAGAADIWVPAADSGPTAIAGRAALEGAVAGGASGSPDLRGLFARLATAASGAVRRPGMPLPPVLAPPAPRPACPRAGPGVRWLPRRIPDAGLPTILLMLHTWGGGTERYAQMLGRHLAGRANVLYGTAREDRLFRLGATAADAPEVEWDVAADGLEGPVATLRGLGVDQVDVLHTIGFETRIEDLLDALAVPFDVTLLDYHLVGSRTHLTDESGRFVGDEALEDPGHPARRREPLPALMHGASRILACSRDLAWRATRLTGLDVIPVEVPDVPRLAQFAIQAATPSPGETLRVVCLGRIAPHKGGADIAAVARLAAARDFPLKLYCLGQDVDVLPVDLQEGGTIEVLGGYDEPVLQQTLCALRPHLAWLPFRAPETYSFSLSDCMAAGLPILATGVGAVPERVAGRDATWLVPPAEASPETILSWLERLKREGMKTPPRWLPTDHLPPLRRGFYDAEYLRFA